MGSSLLQENALEHMFYDWIGVQGGASEDMEHMMALMDADKSRPIDDPAPIREPRSMADPLCMPAASTVRRLPGRIIQTSAAHQF